MEKKVLNTEEIFKILEKHRGEFYVRSNGAIRHKTLKTQDQYGAYEMCPLAFVGSCIGQPCENSVCFDFADLDAHDIIPASDNHRDIRLVPRVHLQTLRTRLLALCDSHSTDSPTTTTVPPSQTQPAA